MRTPYQYLIEPEGDRYNNERDGLIVNTTMDETDFKYTNRIGRVIGLPARDGVLEVGDKVIVHHNTFRKWFNVRGNLKDSANFVKKGVFQAMEDTIYAYDRGDGWKTIEDWVFVKPIENEGKDIWNIGEYETQIGFVKYANSHVGKKVFFDKHSEYRFDIDGEILYRMREQDLMLLL